VQKYHLTYDKHEPVYQHGTNQVLYTSTRKCKLTVTAEDCADAIRKLDKHVNPNEPDRVTFTVRSMYRRNPGVYGTWQPVEEQDEQIEISQS
jgi:hypothetical protein